MTDRVKGFIVTLDKDIRIDDVQVIKQAIQMIKCVASVEESISGNDDQMNRERMKYELRDKFYDFMKEHLT